MAVLRINPPWAVDGQSLLADEWTDPKPPFRHAQSIYTPEGKIKEFGEITLPEEHFRTMKTKLNRVDVIESDIIGKSKLKKESFIIPLLKLVIRFSLMKRTKFELSAC